MTNRELAEDYIKRQERFYNRPLSGFSKFLLREFAVFIEKKKELPQDNPKVIPSTKNTQPISGNQLKVALITEDVGHLTGGRYYCWFIASALVELGYEVTVYTNQKPVFHGEFDKYNQPKIEVIAKRAKDLEAIDIKADIYIGSPISGDIAAARLGKRYNKPSFALIFDPFPMMAKYLGQHSYVGWAPLIANLRATDINIIALCDTTAEFIYDWLNKRKGQVFPIYPCINSRELDLSTEVEKENYVVFTSRLVRHKNFEHVLRACKHLGVRLKVIASVDGINANQTVKSLGMSKQVDFHFKVSDKEKFDIIRGAQVMINGSKFEGFGMWFIEALACGVPTVCYDYPTIHEIKKFDEADNVYMAEWNDPNDLEKQLKKALEEKKFREPSHKFDFEQLVKQVQKVFTIEPKIGVVTIALNEEEFIGASLRSVIKHPNIVKVAVVEGAVNLYPTSTKEGLSVDNTAEEVRNVVKEKNGNKIIFDRYGWAVGKSELRNRALSFLPEDVTHVLVVDADEVWKQEDLDKLVQAMRDNPHTGTFLFPFYHFWKNKNLVASGGQWESQMFRCFRFENKSLHWGLHNAPVINSEGKFINITDGSVELPEVHVYHYGYMKKDKNVQDKLEYYKKRDGFMLNVKDTYTNWKMGDPTQPTHGGGTVTKFSKKHPKEVQEII